MPTTLHHPRHWSDFKSKEEVRDYMTEQREESFRQREEVRGGWCTKNSAFIGRV